MRLVPFPCNDIRKAFTVLDGIFESDAYAFTYNISLEWVAIPESVSAIGPDSFSRCSSLTGISLPGRVVKIGRQVFCPWDDLERVTIRYGVLEIGSRAFENCRNLMDIVIRDSACRIETGAFNNWDNLTFAVGQGCCANRYCETMGSPRYFLDSIR